MDYGLYWILFPPGNSGVKKKTIKTMRICPKCGYERKSSDIGPDYECPKCGVIYDKVKITQKKLDDTVENIPPLLSKDTPTKRQLNYARDLGLNIEPGMTKQEISDFISLKVDKDKPVNERLLSIAESYNIKPTKYIGKKALFNIIFYELNTLGKEKDLIAWFAYRVYRNLVHGSDDGPVDHPGHPIIQKIADDLSKIDMVVKSIKRYEGENLIWFGTYTSPSGNVYYGGSNKTKAYEIVSSVLNQHLDLKKYAKQNQKYDGIEDKQTGLDKDNNKSVKSIGCTGKQVKFNTPVKIGCFPILIISAIVSLTYCNIVSTNTAKYKEKAKTELAKKPDIKYQVKKPLTRQEIIEKSFSVWDDSHIKLEKYIKENMNNPGSYEHIKTRYWNMGDHLVIITEYRGTNKYGGIVSNWIKADTDINGNIRRIIETNQ